MRPALAGLFALALASTVLAGDGLVLVPHSHAPGEPADHPHGIALYRFPIALLGAPADAPQRADDRSGEPSFRLTRPLAETLVGASLILLAGIALVAAVRPVARTSGGVVMVPSAARQWWSLTPTGPPRRALLSI